MGPRRRHRRPTISQVLPEVRDREPLVDMKERGVVYQLPRAYEDIEIPKNSAAGVVLGGLAFVLGFSMVWQIWWLVIVCGVAMWVTLALRASDDESEFVLSVRRGRADRGRALPGPQKSERQPAMSANVTAMPSDHVPESDIPRAARAGLSGST